MSEALNDLQVQSRQIQADILYNVIWEGQEIILHVEFQRRHDEDMGKRAWAYNALSTILNQRPTRTFVIYLVKDHSIVQPPYQLRLDSGELIHQFYYQNIYLWELSTEMLNQPGLEGMLPLLPLGKDGAQREARRRELRHQRQVLSTYIEKHFPDIVPLAIAQTNDIDDPEVLQRLLLGLLSAQSDDEVEQAILSISEQLE